MCSSHPAKVLITGATGMVGRSIAAALVLEHEVWALARFTNPATEAELHAQGVRTWRWDLCRDGLEGLPQDFTHVLHAAVQRGQGSDVDTTIAINTGAVGRLMRHCRDAAVIFLSTAAVYRQQPLDHLYVEHDELGGVLEVLPAYPVMKIACEGAVRAFTAAFDTPAVVARLNFAYGPYGSGGLPVQLARELRAGQPIALPLHGDTLASPIHTDDLVRQIWPLWAAATVPAVTLNWGGDDVVSLEECARYVGELTGVTPQLRRGISWRPTYAFDNARRRALVGRCHVGWQEGFRRTLEAHHQLR